MKSILELFFKRNRNRINYFLNEEKDNLIKPSSNDEDLKENINFINNKIKEEENNKFIKIEEPYKTKAPVLVEEKANLDSNIINIYKDLQVIYRKNGINGILLDKNKLNEPKQVIVFIGLITELIYNDKLPKDTKFTLLPAGDNDKYMPDALLYSREDNWELSIQFKSRNVEKPLSFNTIKDYCYKYNKTNLIILMINEQNIENQINIIENMDFIGANQLVFMSINENILNLNIEYLAKIVLLSSFNSMEDKIKLNEFYRKKNQIIDNITCNFSLVSNIIVQNKEKTLWYNNLDKKYNKDDIFKNDLLALVIANAYLNNINLPSDKLPKQYNKNYAELKGSHQYLSGVKFYCSIKRIEQLKQNNIEPTVSAFFIANATGFFKDN